MTQPDFAKIAADLAGDTGLAHVIRAALHEAWNAALECAASEIAKPEKRLLSWDVAAGVRAKKLPTGGP